MIRSVELGQLALFASLPRDELVALMRVAHASDHRHGSYVFREADPCDGVTVIGSGYVWLHRASPSGTEVTTGIVGPGGLAAVAPLRGEAEHDDDAVALGRVRTITFPVATLLHLLGNSPRVFAELSHGLAARRDQAFAATNVAAQGQLFEQILHVLRQLARPARTEVGDPMRRLAVRLTHAEVARLVGADRVSVTRTLQLLETRGLIQRERGHITGVVPVMPSDRYGSES